MPASVRFLQRFYLLISEQYDMICLIYKLKRIEKNVWEYQKNKAVKINNKATQ